MSELIPGKKYTHPEWGQKIPCLYIGKDSCGSLVFEATPRSSLFRSLNTTGFEEVKEKKKGWVNIYPGKYSGVQYDFHDTREKADEKADNSQRIACIEVEYYEGQGL